MGEVAYQNKDITSKLFAESLKEKNFAVYGVKTPKVKEIWPTNLPRIAANELRMDNLFLLEDGSLAILDYESKYTVQSKIKYINYIIRVYEKYRKKYPNIIIRMIVIYTSDVEQKNVKLELDMGCLQMRIEAGYLSGIDPKQTYAMLKNKIEGGQEISDEEAMLLTILPLTTKGKKNKEELLEKSVSLAKLLADEEQKVAVIAGIVTFSDKIISEEYSNRLKEWIRMTKVGRLFEEEKIEAVKEATERVTKEVTKETKAQLVHNAYESLGDVDKVAELLKLQVEEVVEIVSKP